MAQYGTGDLSTPDVMEGHADDGQAAFPLHERLEEAAHTAHTVACHLRLLVAACMTQRGPSFHLCTHSFVAGMQHLSECVRELEDQLDVLPLNDRHASHEVEKCSCIAMRAAGLMRLIADAAGERGLDQLEVDIEDFMVSLQELAGRMKEIEGCLEQVRRRRGEPEDFTSGAW